MSNPIAWCDETLNPIVGCTANCCDPDGRPYCYARRMAHRNLTGCPDCANFIPHFHPERLEKLAHWKKPRRIFMDSMSDWWDPHVPQAWRDECYAAMAANPQHRYLVLTKQPQNVTAGDLHQYPGAVGTGGLALGVIWLGVTIEGPDSMWRQARSPHRFISAEPLFDAFYVDGPANHEEGETETQWLILGADSRRNPYIPGEAAFLEMIQQADDLGIPVFLKDNALKHYPGLPVRREFPEGLRLPHDERETTRDGDGGGEE